MTSLDHASDLLHLFGDASRVRLLALLAQQELTVAELTASTGLAQSRVSTHLGKLKDAGLVRDQRRGASTVYTLENGGMPPEARKVWALLADELRDPVLEADRARCEALLRARTRATGWSEAVAGQMERHYSPGRTWEATAHAFLGLVRLGDVLDVGSGDGTIARLLAPRVRTITCLDRNEAMIRAARARLAAQPGVRFLLGDLHAIPAADASFDQVLVLNVLASAAHPNRGIAEAARVLRPGGSLVLVTLDAHADTDVAATYGHVHPGFKPAALRRWLGKAGLAVEQCEVTTREKRPPHFDVVTAVARKPGRR